MQRILPFRRKSIHIDSIEATGSEFVIVEAILDELRISAYTKSRRRDDEIVENEKQP
jgi:hypothetical protein